MTIFPTKWRANEQQGGGGSHQPVSFFIVVFNAINSGW